MHLYVCNFHLKSFLTIFRIPATCVLDMFFRQDRFPISWNTSRRIRVNFVLFGKVSLVHEALFGAPVAQVPGRVRLCLFLVWAFSDANMLQTGNGKLTWKLFFRSRNLLLGVLPLWVTPPLIAPNVEVAYSQSTFMFSHLAYLLYHLPWSKHFFHPFGLV